MSRPSTPMKMNRPRIASRIHSVLIPSAFGEPPDSGRKMPAEAVCASVAEASRASVNTAPATLRRRRFWGAGGATGAEVYGRRGREHPPGWRSGRALTVGALTGRSPAGELRRPLLQEGQDALAEVARRSGFLLDGGLELELLLHAREEPAVELALDPGVGPGRSGGEPGGERVHLGGELRLGHGAVGQAPLDGLPGADAL